ncbi:MAG: hypothetical protein DELT_02537 [Desulfovibrio sp.]
MNWKHYTVIGLLIVLALWRIDNVQGKLKLERSEHQNTKDALADAIEKGNGWKAAYEEARSAAEAHREATQACLDREAEARAASQERKAILQAAQPRPRAETERTQVVDDETRKRTADRLNRPL